MPKMLRYRAEKTTPLRVIVLIAVFCFTTSHSAAQTSPAGPLPPARPSDEPTATAPVAKPRSAALLGDKPNLSGTWNLNKDQSDDPQQLIEQASKSSRSSDGGRVRGGWGGGVWGGPGGTGGAGPRTGTRSQGQRRESRDMTDELSQITIEQSVESAKITGPNGDVLGTYSKADPSHSNSSNTSPADTSSGSSRSGASGGSSNASDGEGSRANPVAKWKGNQLVVVTSGAHGVTMTRTYELSSDSQQLDITTKIDNPHFKHPVTINFVYDPAPSGG